MESYLLSIFYCLYIGNAKISDPPGSSSGTVNHRRLPEERHGSTPSSRLPVFTRINQGRSEKVVPIRVSIPTSGIPDWWRTSGEENYDNVIHTSKLY